MEAGHLVTDDVIFVLLTPQGSKDVVERVAADWLAEKRLQVASNRFPGGWLTQYEQMYEAFKRNEEMPVNGIPLENWPAISPSQVANCKQLNLRTVEDVASMNEEAIHRFGMGGRMMKDRALAYLDAAKNIGVSAETIAALKTENKDKEAQIAELQASVAKLSATVEALRPQPAEAQAVKL